MKSRQVCLMILLSLIPVHAPLPAVSEEPRTHDIGLAPKERPVRHTSYLSKSGGV